MKINFRIIALSLLFISISTISFSQNQKFSLADSLRGSLRPQRTCYDVYYYDLFVRVNVLKKSIDGFNNIYFHTAEKFTELQIDLFNNLNITKILFRGEELKYKRIADAVFITFPNEQQVGDTGKLFISYKGTPISAKNAPWDGGFVWKKDANGKDWVGVACEGTGASLWWPTKEYLGDEPDSMKITFNAPTGLTCVSNGRLINHSDLTDQTTNWIWKVSYPINNYNVTFNLADYVLVTDTFVRSNNSKLSLDYYVLHENEWKAKQHFQQVKTMMACYEKVFGEYPFTRDGYKLVESFYWGMEHQTAVAYGNNFENNKWGFDYIIIHETAHEWWGNNVSCQDIADMWIHESFATYSETMYEECTRGYDTSVAYLLNQKWDIQDKLPIIGLYGVNYEHDDNDQYFKGAWVIHTFRNMIANDELFFSILKGIQKQFALKCISSDQLIQYINNECRIDYTWFFNQYLHYATAPVFTYSIKQKGKNLELWYKWKSDVQEFHLPIKVVSNVEGEYAARKETYIKIFPNTAWQKVIIKNLKAKDFAVDQTSVYCKIEFIKKFKEINF